MSQTQIDVERYFLHFTETLFGIQATNAGKTKLKLGDSVRFCVALVQGAHKNAGALRFIGNGGSAAIASHQATDFIRTCKIAAYAPLDPTLLTCMGNDFGYSDVFSKSLQILARKEDVLIAISSSGQSDNILNAVHVMREKRASVITLSGFGADNPLRRLGDINFYVPSDSYRVVESAHLFICNLLLEFTIKELDRSPAAQ